MPELIPLNNYHNAYELLNPDNIHSLAEHTLVDVGNILAEEEDNIPEDIMVVGNSHILEKQ